MSPHRTPADRSSVGARVTAWAVLAALALLDVAVAGDRHPVWPAVVFFVVVAAVVDERPFVRFRAGEFVRIAAPVVTSLAFTISTAFADWSAFGPGETGVLAVLFAAAVRGLRGVRAVVVAGLAAVAMVTIPLREKQFLSDPGDVQTVVALMLAMVVVLAGALMAALYLRALDDRRHDAVVRTRVGERADMAAELHDFVAHHVTGILAEARMAQMMLDGDPAEVRAGLQRIESSASDALTSMRQTVHLLRGARDPSAAPVDTGDLSAVPDLLERSGLTVTLTRSVQESEQLPPSLQAAAFRVIRESLTNVRKHAGPGSPVEVTLDVERGELVVGVHNGGTPGRIATAVVPGGFGLIGLAERVHALGGSLRHGPDGRGGWQVVARLPIPGPRRR